MILQFLSSKGELKADEGNTFIRGSARLKVQIHSHFDIQNALQLYGIYQEKCSQWVEMFPVVAWQNTESGHSPEHKYLELPEIAEGQGVWKDEGA